MTDHRPFGAEQHVDDVDAAALEAAHGLGRAAQERAGGAEQLLLLCVVDAREAASVRAGAAVADLDHDQHGPEPADDVELVAAEPEVLPQNEETAGEQILDSGSFGYASPFEGGALGSQATWLRSRRYWTHFLGSFASSEVPQLSVALNSVLAFWQ